MEHEKYTHICVYTHIHIIYREDGGLHMHLEYNWYPLSFY